MLEGDLGDTCAAWGCGGVGVCWRSDFIYTVLCLSGRLDDNIRDSIDLTFIEHPLCLKHWWFRMTQTPFLPCLPGKKERSTSSVLTS